MILYFRPLLKRLSDQQVRFVLIGGAAAWLHGSSLPTEDVDICAPLDEENCRRIIAAIGDLKPKFRFHIKDIAMPTNPKELAEFRNLNLNTELGVIDILGDLPGIGDFDSLQNRTVVMEFGAFRCRAIDIDTLIEVKTKVGRLKDQLAVTHLLEVKRQLQAEPPLPFDESPGT